MTTKKPNNKPTIIIMTAIIGIAGLEGIALMTGHDGVLFTFCVGIIAGLAGWVSPQPQFMKQ